MNNKLIFSLFFLFNSFALNGIYFPYADVNGYYQGENAEGGTYDPRKPNDGEVRENEFNEYFEATEGNDCQTELIPNPRG